MRKPSLALVAFALLSLASVPWAAVTPTFSQPPSPLPTDPLPPVPTPPEVVYFPETGHYVGYGFLRFFKEQGGLGIFGYPRTEEMVEEERTVQYFQRSRFEYWPEQAGTPYEVRLSLLGDLLITGRPFVKGEPFPDSEEHRYYTETGYGIHFAFLKFFQERGGLDIFGYPMSGELHGEGGWPHAVQYFQRARFEYHPEKVGTPYEAQLGLLGDEYLVQKGWLRGPEAPPPTPRPVRTPDSNTPPQTGRLEARWGPGREVWGNTSADYPRRGPFQNLAVTEPYVGKNLTVGMEEIRCRTGTPSCQKPSLQLHRSLIGELEPSRDYSFGDARYTRDSQLIVERGVISWRIEYGQYFLFFETTLSSLFQKVEPAPETITYVVEISE